MSGGKYLLLLQLAEHVLLGGCQSQTVSIFPNLKRIYVGDSFSLRCQSQDEGEVTWFFNNKVVPESKDASLKTPVAARKHSGTYHCERNGVNSSSISINVLGYYPRASLILKTGQPVMPPDGSVTLRLDNDRGLREWKCYVFKKEQTIEIRLMSVNDSLSFEFQPYKLVDPETIFWCANKNRSQRSNQVIIRTSDKSALMEMYFAPVVAGDPLVLRCLHWGVEKISHVVFYKNNEAFAESSNPIYSIRSVSDSDQGDYKCHATFTHKSLQVSDVQQLVVQEEVMRAVVSGTMGLSCSCPDCPSIAGYIWYKITEDSRPLELPGNSQGFTNPDESGTYACVVVWDFGRSFISRGHPYNPAVRTAAAITASLIFILFVLAAAGAVFWKYTQTRGNTDPLYEDVMLKTREDNRYERLLGHRPPEESQYDTIQPAESLPGKEEGDYQPLVKAGETQGVYHSLGMDGEASGAGVGGYEALQRKTMKGEIYHSIGMEGATKEE